MSDPLETCAEIERLIANARSQIACCDCDPTVNCDACCIVMAAPALAAAYRAQAAELAAVREERDKLRGALTRFVGLFAGFTMLTPLECQTLVQARAALANAQEAGQ